MSRSILAWCLYDLANTIFAMNMTSYHFPVWLVSERGGSEFVYSLAFGSSMTASALLMPWLGRRIDQGRRRIVWLMLWTAACVFCTAVLGFVQSLAAALAVFAAANFCYQIAGVIYNALLPSVAPEGRMGRVSGYGVALGYVGTLIGILATAPILARWGRQATFVPTALLFGLFSVPTFLWVRERASTGSARTDTLPLVLSSSKDERQVVECLRPLLAPASWGLSVIGVAILFMSVYAKQAVHLSDAQLQSFLIAATAVTVVGTFLWGRVTEKLGAFRALEWVWFFWALTFGLGLLGFDPGLFFVVSCLSGVALGGTWVASRVLLVEWVGPERAGESFGLFGFISRISAVLGPMVWAGILWLLTPMGQERYRVGMGILFISTLIGWRLYHRIKIP